MCFLSHEGSKDELWRATSTELSCLELVGSFLTNDFYRDLFHADRRGIYLLNLMIEEQSEMTNHREIRPQ